MKVGFYPGSFDPFTNGHLHVLKQAASLFDRVIICIQGNPMKRKRRFDKNIMKGAIEKVLAREGLENVTVVMYDSFLVKVKKYGAMYLVRGIRNEGDYKYEEAIAKAHESLMGINTLYLRAGSLNTISSTKVMEMLASKKDVSKYVPQEILEVISPKT